MPDNKPSFGIGGFPDSVKFEHGKLRGEAQISAAQFCSGYSLAVSIDDTPFDRSPLREGNVYASRRGHNIQRSWHSLEGAQRNGARRKVLEDELPIGISHGIHTGIRPGDVRRHVVARRAGLRLYPIGLNWNAGKRTSSFVGYDPAHLPLPRHRGPSL